MKDNYDFKAIISKEDFERIIINEIYRNNLVSYVDKIEISDQSPFARYYFDRRKLSFNYNQILYYTNIKANKYKFNTEEEKIKYINYSIISIVLHEIIHVRQKKEENLLITLSEQAESELKKYKLYGLNLYMTNPIERQAHVLSLSEIILYDCAEFTLMNKIFKGQLINILKYGYSNLEYPIYVFFKGTSKFEIALDLASSVTQKIDEKLEYGCQLTSDEYKKVKELKIWKHI